MTWIETVSTDSGDEALARAYAMQRTLYPAMYGEPAPPREGRQAESIVATHSLIPEALYHAFGTFGALMSPELPLGRQQHEMIATVVSVTNRCRY
jgi:hypothetical protein